MEYETFEDDIFYDIYGMRVWQKRHSYVSKVLAQNKCEKVIDFGCSDGKFLQRLTCSDQYKLLVGVDIDDEALDLSMKILNDCDIKHSMTIQRPYDMKVKLYNGSVFEKYEEIKKEQFDACSMIEMIEHVYKDQLPYIEQNVFGYLNIPLVIVTTPNFDFNEFFPFYKANPTKFRHDDHKYEFTQLQFKQWSENICQTYDYSVEYEGIGPKKDGDLSKGYCSQVAIFKRNNQYTQQIESSKGDYPLQLLQEYTYPTNKRIPQNELKRQINNIYNNLYFYKPEYFIDTSKTEQGYIEEKNNFLDLKFFLNNQLIAESELIDGNMDKLVEFVEQQKEYKLSDKKNKIQIQFILDNYEKNYESDSDEQNNND